MAIPGVIGGIMVPFVGRGVIRVSSSFIDSCACCVEMLGIFIDDGALSLRILLDFELLFEVSASRSFRNLTSRPNSSSISLANKKRKTHFPRFTLDELASSMCDDAHGSGVARES